VLIYGLMKFVEQAPFHYEKFMNIISLGRYGRSLEKLIEQVSVGDSVLDVGCGSGKVALGCAKKGAQVVALDSSIQMLDILRSRAKKQSLSSNIKIVNAGSASMDKVLNGEKFDVIIASLMLGELIDDLRFRTLMQMRDHLKDKGFILINDELWPDVKIKAFFYNLLFCISFIPNFLFTRTVIRPVKNLPDDLAKLNLKIDEKKNMGGGIVFLKVSKRP